ncbi:hypothetical protein F5Y10DRAFT_76708 [Nemania abortiva]|nr:hypothetical protein F5Y10DRAFT_76708 [Nemania abortiva]
MFFFPEPRGLRRMRDGSRSSVGVELEFLVCVATAGQALDVPERFENANGGPIFLDPESNDLDARFRVQSRIQETITNAVAQHRGARVVELEDYQRQQGSRADTDAIHLRPYRDWTVGEDPSVRLEGDDILTVQFERFMNRYDWRSVEIASPALWVADESWEEIQAVVQALRDEFWIFIPSNAGMHYHYGNGKEYIPFGNLRRIAALLVAVDPILVQLHPEHRRENPFCHSNRLYSRIAHGRPAAVTSRELGAEDVEEAPEFPTVQPLPAPAARPFRQRSSSFTVPFRRGQLTGYTFRPQIFLGSGFDEDNAAFLDDVNENDGPITEEDEIARNQNVRPLEIPYAVREILRSVNAPTVAELMRYSALIGDRPAYSFLAYSLNRYRQLLRDGNRVSREQNKRTIEFRQMASTMEPDEVVAHGIIIVGLCEFAAEASLEDLWKVVLDCTVAEVDGDWFDVFDLLADLGLTSEARVLQYAVAQFRDEDIPEEHSADGDVDDGDYDDDENAPVATERVERRSWWRRLLGWYSS